MRDLNTDSKLLMRSTGRIIQEVHALKALWVSGQATPKKLQRALEAVTDAFERGALMARQICEASAPGVGGYAHKTICPVLDVVGHVGNMGENWLHIKLNTLLPHCRYQTAEWLTDTIRRLLDEYEAKWELPYYRRAMLIIDEYSDIPGRHIYDQDNKGWKAVSNAIKGRLIPDDDQYTLSVALLSGIGEEPACHITLIPMEDADNFFALRAGDYASERLYDGRWSQQMDV